jgi:hypothetical protein
VVIRNEICTCIGRRTVKYYRGGVRAEPEVEVEVEEPARLTEKREPSTTVSTLFSS